jgi:cephalosporin-C deacetylase-like acetyl esterase
VPLSNFGDSGLARVGSYQGMTRFGVYDMAGNAKEWCWNEAAEGRRFILGGGYGEPEYMYSDLDAQSPFDRSLLNGFRCIKLLAEKATDAKAYDKYIRTVRDYAKEKPVTDLEFELFRRQYSYDKKPLDARVESVDSTDTRWRREKVEFNTAYNNERMTAFLYIPQNHQPPFQSVVFFPGANALTERSSEKLVPYGVLAPIIESGRVLVWPIYKGTYERGSEPWKRPSGRTENRDHRIQLSKDLGRTIDYLETREDILADGLAYCGISWGAALGPVLTAVESRLKICMLIVGGFYQSRPLPEIDAFNFAPRVTIPTLMINGRYDFTFPLETTQRPMFAMLGTPAEHKSQVLFDTGHAVPTDQCSREILVWLDKYLGPVKK